MVECSVDERDASWMGHNGTYHSSEERPFESDDEDLEKRGIVKSTKGKAAKKPYHRLLCAYSSHRLEPADRALSIH